MHINLFLSEIIIWGLYDYNGNQNELSFKKDDKMLLLDDT